MAISNRFFGPFHKSIGIGFRLREPEIHQFINVTDVFLVEGGRGETPGGSGRRGRRGGERPQNRRRRSPGVPEGSREGAGDGRRWREGAVKKGREGKGSGGGWGEERGRGRRRRNKSMNKLFLTFSEITSKFSFW